MAAILSGCATNRLAFATEAQAVLADEHGTAFARSSKRNRVEVRLLTPRFSKKTTELPAFSIAVTNGSDAPLRFARGDVSAFVGQTPVALYTVEELRVRIAKDAVMAAYAADAQGQSQIALANMARTVPGSPSVVGAQVNRLSDLASVQTAAAKQTAGLGGLLNAWIVPPGETRSGTVKLHAEDVRPGARLRLEVKVGDEVHEFAFEVGD